MKLDRDGNVTQVRNMPGVDKTHAETFVVSPDDNRIAIATYTDQGSVLAVRLYTSDLIADTNVHELASTSYPITCVEVQSPTSPCAREAQGSVPIPKAWYGNVVAVGQAGYPAGYQLYPDSDSPTPSGVCQPWKSPDGTLNRIVDAGPAGMLCLHRLEGFSFDKTIELIQPDGTSRVVFRGETSNGWAAEAPDGSKVAAMPQAQVVSIYDSELNLLGTIAGHYIEGWLDSNTVIVTETNLDTELYDITNLQTPIVKLVGGSDGVVRS